MNNAPNNYYRTSVKALILDEQKRFLLSLEENGSWELLGGGLDFGETPQECLHRELKEEAGLEITYINEYPSYFVTGQTENGVWKANVLYEIRVKDLQFEPSDECIELKFFTKDEALKENLYPTVREFVSLFDPVNHL